MSADPSLFVFGHLATPEHLAEQARRHLAGLFHGYRIEPRDPTPLEPVNLLVETGGDAAITSVWIVYTVDGSAPNESSATVEARRVETRWDELSWQYVDVWVTTLPPQDEGARVRYVVRGRSSLRGDDLFADAGREDAPPTLFGYDVDRLTAPSWMRDAVLYQIFVDRFYSPDGDFGRPLAHGDEIYGGSLSGITERLDYLSDLGVDGLWLTPVVEAETYHGYDALDFRQVGRRVGGPAALHRLVDCAHARDIKVLLDLALNHCSWRNSLFLDAQQRAASSYHDWFTFLEWPARYQSFFGSAYLPELNTRNPEVVRYLCDTAAWYLSEFDVDGFRLDYALGPPMLFWSELRRRTRAVKADAYTVAEATTGPSGLRAFEGRLDGCLDFPMLQAFRRFFVHDSWDAAAFHRFVEQHDSYFRPEFSRPTFLDNHDMNRFLWSAGNDVRRLKLAATCQFSLPQPPIIYYGTEVGLSQENDTQDIGFAASRLPMLWGDRQNLGLLDFYRALVRVRKRHPALRRGRRVVLQTDGGLYAYRCELEGDRVVVVLNRSQEARRAHLPGVAGHDALSGARIMDGTGIGPMQAAVVEYD